MYLYHWQQKNAIEEKDPSKDSSYHHQIYDDPWLMQAQEMIRHLIYTIQYGQKEITTSVSIEIIQATDINLSLCNRWEKGIKRERNVVEKLK